MDSVNQLQKKLDAVFENGAVFTYRMSMGASTTLIASKAWALREHGDTVLVGIVFAMVPRHWIHRVSEVRNDGGWLSLLLPNGKSVTLWPLNTEFVASNILERVKNDNRTKEELLEEVDAFLEANPHKSLDNF
jgi:hypothetical protein